LTRVRAELEEGKQYMVGTTLVVVKYCRTQHPKRPAELQAPEFNSSDEVPCDVVRVCMVIVISDVRCVQAAACGTLPDMRQLRGTI
jgi:hypothetical protein